MTSSNALAADQEFFQSLLSGNVREVETLLADDFMLIDVMQGSEVPRSAFLDLLAGGQLQFESIVPSGLKVRLYGDAAIITGTTEMRVGFDGSTMAVPGLCTAATRTSTSCKPGRWRLASAQGTPIPGS
jgi:predicted DNA-binding protein YlxM (UPF0122 family)